MLPDHMARLIAFVFEIYLEQFTIVQMNSGREVSRRLRKADDLLFQVQMQTSTPDPSERFYSG